METMNVSFNELSAMAFEQRSSKLGLHSMASKQISSGLDLTYAPSTITTQQPPKGELDLLFEAMYDNYIGGQPSATQRSVLAAQAQQVRQTSTTSTSIADTEPMPTNSSSQVTNFPSTSQDVDGRNTQQQQAQQQGNQASLHPKIVADNVPNVMFDANTFVNPFATPSTSAAESSSSQYVDPSNMHTFYQPYPHEFQWTKDRPLEQNVKEAMTDHTWIESMQEELLHFKRMNVWVLVPSPDNISPLTLKWIFKNKNDEKTRSSEISFIDVDYPSHVYKLKKELYGLKQAPKAWRIDNDILVVHVYVDDIIFGSTHPRYTQLFSDLMKSRFEMSMMGEMTFFLGLQVNQSPCGIFINQSNYVLEILKKYGMESCDPVGTPMEIKDKLDLDHNGTPVDVTKYHSMIGALMYLTSSRPDIVHATCLCAWYQAKPTEKHLKEEHMEKGTIELYFVKKNCQLADIFTKALPADQFNYLVRSLGMRSLSPQELNRLAKSQIRRQRYNLIPAESKFKTPCLIVKDKYMMKAQVRVSKSSAISDIQALPQKGTLSTRLPNNTIMSNKMLREIVNELSGS
uniref:Reverse transcriptase Ty1/copia-type domain-containing protein n=1 Tax=Tanacetum cinerariifolium TaxID=118510 RepID=A0A6L2J9M6_TANCI|nr:hypothetical protein [Tanacetum cinerariifolium]